MAENTTPKISILSDDDVRGKRVSSLANRPTNSSGYGSHGLSSAELKARMDDYSDAIRDKLNDLIGLFNDADIPITMTWNGTDIESLSELVELIQTPDFADHLLIHNDATPSVGVPLKNYIKQYKQTTEQSALKSEGYAVGEQDGVAVTEGTYFKNNAKYFADEAEASAQSASASAGTASSAKGDAVTARNEAVTAKNTAVSSAGEASASALTAKQYSENADEQASIAEGYAGDAERSKGDAIRYAGDAETFAQTAGRYLDEMDEKYSAKLDKKPNGTNDLITNGKIDTRYIPDSILGQLKYAGTWNAETGIAFPLWDDSRYNESGYYWICTKEGHKTPSGINDPNYSYDVGDWTIMTIGILLDRHWDKVDNTDAVHSVNGKIGDVVAKASGVDIYGVEYDSIDGAVFSGAFHTLNADNEEDSITGTINLPIIPGEGMTIGADKEREHLILKPDLDVLQRKLPTVVNDRYLHTNATTGAFEWSEVEQGSSSDENAVHYTAETKTASEKAQARENIGAIGSTNAELGDAMPVVADNLKGISSATVGQFAKVKTVDDNGNPTEWEGAEAGGGMVNPMTTTGDIIYSESGGTPARKAIGSNGQVLKSNGIRPYWATMALYRHYAKVTGRIVTSSFDGNAEVYVLLNNGDATSISSQESLRTAILGSGYLPFTVGATGFLTSGEETRLVVGISVTSASSNFTFLIGDGTNVTSTTGLSVTDSVKKIM